MTIIMIILAVIGGATLSIQAAINGQLGSRVGVFKSAFLTFSVGALITGLLIFFFESPHAVSLAGRAEMATVGGDVRGTVHCHHGARRTAHWHCGRHRRGDIWPVNHEYAY